LLAFELAGSLAVHDSAGMPRRIAKVKQNRKEYLEQESINLVGSLSSAIASLTWRQMLDSALHACAPHRARRPRKQAEPEPAANHGFRRNPIN